MKRALLMLLFMFLTIHSLAQELYMYVNTLEDLEDPNVGRPDDDGRCDVDLSKPGDQCTFRAAIQNANLSRTSRTYIRFYLLTAPVEPVVKVGSTGLGPLPPITRQNISIDGGFLGPLAGNVTLDGSMAGANAIGMQILAPEGFCEISSFAIRRFSSHGIYIRGSSGNWIYNNVIGADSKANAGQGNGGDGIHIENSGYNEIRGGNFIAGNRSWGIYIRGDTLPDGLPTAEGNRISGNRIGQVPGGDIVPNGRGGIMNDNAAGTFIGMRYGLLHYGSTIMGAKYGIVVTGWLSQDVTIQDNIIGRSGSQPAFTHGILVKDHASAAIINDTISGNSKGVVVAGSVARAYLDANSIFDNNGLGIDLWNDGVTRNDPGDVDEGPNNLQNFPVLKVVRSDSGNTTIYGSLNSKPRARYTLQFFSNASCSVVGHGEGKSFLGSSQVITGADGNASFMARLTGISLPAGMVVTATATDAAQNTSEFSACREVSGSIEDQLVKLGVQVNALRNSHDLTPQQAAVLNALLGAAIRSYREGYTKLAVTALQVFNAMVEFFMYNRYFHRLPVSKGLPLIHSAQNIITQLSAMDAEPALVMNPDKDHKAATLENGVMKKEQELILKSVPNPFNAVTTISFELPEQANVKLNVIDLQGRPVALLKQAVLPAGRHTVFWQPVNLPPGIFLLRLDVNDTGKTIKIMHVE